MPCCPAMMNVTSWSCSRPSVSCRIFKKWPEIQFARQKIELVDHDANAFRDAENAQRVERTRQPTLDQESPGSIPGGAVTSDAR